MEVLTNILDELNALLKFTQDNLEGDMYRDFVSEVMDAIVSVSVCIVLYDSLRLKEDAVCLNVSENLEQALEKYTSIIAQNAEQKSN